MSYCLSTSGRLYCPLDEPSPSRTKFTLFCTNLEWCKPKHSAVRNFPKAFLLSFPRWYNSPKWKGHPIYSKPYLRLSHSQYLYRRTLSLVQYCCLSRVFCRFFKFHILRKEDLLGQAACSQRSKTQVLGMKIPIIPLWPSLSLEFLAPGDNSISQEVNFNLLSWFTS